MAASFILPIVFSDFLTQEFNTTVFQINLHSAPFPQRPIAYRWKPNQACCIDFCQEKEIIVAELLFELIYPYMKISKLDLTMINTHANPGRHIPSQGDKDIAGGEKCRLGLACVACLS